MLLNLFVKRFQSFLNFSSWVYCNDFAQFLLAKCHLVANLCFFHTLSYFALNSIEELLYSGS